MLIFRKRRKKKEKKEKKEVVLVKKPQKRRILTDKQIKDLADKHRTIILSKFAERMLSFSRRAAKESRRLGIGRITLNLGTYVDSVKRVVIDLLSKELMKGFGKKYSKEQLEVLREEIKKAISIALGHSEEALKIISALAAEFPTADARKIAEFSWKYRDSDPKRVVEFFREELSKKR